MLYSINPEEIKTEIGKLGHTFTNICSIKNTESSYLPLSKIFVELKPTPNNKDVFNLDYI
jgi:hypothetical protein